MSDEKRNTPHLDDSTSGPASTQVLLAAVAVLDACFLRCPGTDEGRALTLLGSLFDRQSELGFLDLGDGPDLDTESEPYWDAAMAAILYITRDRYPGPHQAAAMWWRQMLAYEARKVDRDFPPCSPSRLAILMFLNRGQRTEAGSDHPLLTGPRLFYKMENTPLPRPSRPWKLPEEK